MRKSPLMKENSKFIPNQKHNILSKPKLKTNSLEKQSYTNRSFITTTNESSYLLTPNQLRKNITTQASDSKITSQHQILRSLMKIQNKTNPSLQANCHHHPQSKAKYISNNVPLCINCSIDQAAKGNSVETLNSKKPNKSHCNSMNQTANSSPKMKTISLSTYTSLGNQEQKDKEIRFDKITQFKNMIVQTRNCLESVRIEEMPNRVESVFNNLLATVNMLKQEVMQQVDKCLNAEHFQIRSTIESLKKMEDDICSNEFNIIEYMTMGPFNDIMVIYEDKFKEHSLFTKQLAQQDLVITSMNTEYMRFGQQAIQYGKQLSQSLQAYLQLYVSFQNKDFFTEVKSHSNNIAQMSPIQIVQSVPSSQRGAVGDNLFQTCETNNSIDEDQVIMKENQGVRLGEATSKFSELLRKDFGCQRSLFPSESPHFKIIKNFQFIPSSLNIGSNTTLNIVIKENVCNNSRIYVGNNRYFILSITPNKLSYDYDEEVETPPLYEQQQYQHNFSTPGEYIIQCVNGVPIKAIVTVSQSKLPIQISTKQCPDKQKRIDILAPELRRLKVLGQIGQLMANQNDVVDENVTEFHQQQKSNIPSFPSCLDSMSTFNSSFQLQNETYSERGDLQLRQINIRKHSDPLVKVGMNSPLMKPMDWKQQLEQMIMIKTGNREILYCNDEITSALVMEYLQSGTMAFHIDYSIHSF